MTNEEQQNLMKHMKSGKYLPKDMRDFHDQKDIFKTIGNRKPNYDEINWRDGHTYAIDHFLWFMALHGYELRKVKSKMPKYDLHATIEERKQEDRDAFHEYLNSSKKD